MFRLGDIPSKTDNLSDLADFIETKCLFSINGSVSKISIQKVLSIESDEIDFEGLTDEEDIIAFRLDEVFAEMQRRRVGCRGHYPFLVESSLVRIDPACGDAYKKIYTFLLLATRANMKKDRFFGNPQKDATLLFEKFCEIIAKSYFGENSNTFLFGTSAGSKFSNKVVGLLRALNFQAQFRDPAGSNGKQKDGKLDVAVWMPFADGRDSMIIGLGQCKTGSSWNGMLSQLQSGNFFRSYVTYQPIHTPLRLFFIADSISDVSESWEESARAAGILFYRSRLMQFIPNNVSQALIGEMESWINYINDKYKLSL